MQLRLATSNDECARPRSACGGAREMNERPQSHNTPMLTARRREEEVLDRPFGPTKLGVGRRCSEAWCDGELLAATRCSRRFCAAGAAPWWPAACNEATNAMLLFRLEPRAPLLCVCYARERRAMPRQTAGW